MPDYHNIMDTFRLLDSVVALGLGADDVVSAAGRLDRGEPLDADHKRILLAASEYIRALVVGGATRSGLGLLAGGNRAEYPNF